MEKEVLYKYVVSQRAYTDVEGEGKVRFVSEGEPVIRPTPAGKELAHILTPVNDIAREVASGDIDMMSADINVLKALIELGEFSVEAARKALKKHKVSTASSDPENLLQRIIEIRNGQPVKKVTAGIDDII